MFLLTENEVELKFRKYLSENGYALEERNSIFGVDITAKKNDRIHYFEVEGNRKPNGAPLTSSQKYTHLLRGFGQICLRMSDNPNGKFALVLPEDEYYTKKLSQLSFAIKKLDIDIWILKHDDRVSKI